MAEENERSPMARAVRAAYRAGEDDETMPPLVLVDARGRPIGRISPGDSVIFYNLRGEREVELCRSLLDDNFSPFPAERLGLKFVTMIPYEKTLKAKIAFPPEEEVHGTLSEVLSKAGLRQAKVAESEKAVHVGFFLNGKVRDPFPGEERIIVPSPRDVAQFDLKPEMNAAGVAEAVARKLADPSLDFLFANFANIDVVGHLENLRAVEQAVETVDFHLGAVLKASREAGVLAIITADHGTVEKWVYPDGSVDTGHTDSPVPFLVIAPEENPPPYRLREGGELADIAPTVLQLMGLPQPDGWTGKSLLAESPPPKRRRVLLVLLDGWGERTETEGNLIAAARTPVMDELRARAPFTRLLASGEAVGLPPGTVGNSEAGHLHIGAGRRVYSDRLRIDRAIEDGFFYRNDAFRWAMSRAQGEGKNLHLLGIVSFFSSHGSVNHLLALLKMARNEGLKRVYLHAMLGRRGEHQGSGARYVELIEGNMRKIGLGRVVSVIGRYWALDREENWERIEKTYRMLVHGEGRAVKDL